MAAEVKKFLFDRVFSDDAKETPFSQVRAEEERAHDAAVAAISEMLVPEQPEEEPAEPEAPPPPTFSEEDLAAARDKAFAEGKAEGAAEAKSSSEAATAKAVEQTARQLEALRAENAAAREAATAESVAIAAAIVRKLLPAADPDIAAREILTVVEEAMGRIYEEPTVVVRVSESLVPALADPIRDAAARAGYPGALTVAPDPAMAVGDCRIEWGIGGVERDLGALWAEVDEIIARNTGVDIANMPSPPAPPPMAEPAPPAAPDTMDGIDQALATLGGEGNDTEMDKPIGGDHG